MYVRMVWGHLKSVDGENRDEYDKYYREKVFPYNDRIDGLVDR